MAKPKIKTMISLDPALKQKGDELVEKDEFPSFSAFITFLMKEYFRKKELEAENNVLQDLDLIFPGMQEAIDRLTEQQLAEQTALVKKFEREFLENTILKTCGNNLQLGTKTRQILQNFGIDYPPQTPENTSPEGTPPET